MSRRGYPGIGARVSWWLFTKALRLSGWLLLAAVAAAVWPLALAAILGYTAAWLSGWPPARLWRAAAWSLPVTGLWLLGHAIASPAWQSVALAPVRD